LCVMRKGDKGQKGGGIVRNHEARGLLNAWLGERVGGIGSTLLSAVRTREGWESRGLCRYPHANRGGLKKKLISVDPTFAGCRRGGAG